MLAGVLAVSMVTLLRLAESWISFLCVFVLSEWCCFSDLEFALLTPRPCMAVATAGSTRVPISSFYRRPFHSSYLATVCLLLNSGCLFISFLLILFLLLPIG
jgi:hypothetical protein